MNYCRYTYTPLEQCFDTPVMLVFTTMCYIIKENKEQEQRMKQWKAQH